MHKIKQTKKLQLPRETIKTLTDDKLVGTPGGFTSTTRYTGDAGNCGCCR